MGEFYQNSLFSANFLFMKIEVESAPQPDISVSSLLVDALFCCGDG